MDITIHVHYCTICKVLHCSQQNVIMMMVIYTLLFLHLQHLILQLQNVIAQFQVFIVINLLSKSFVLSFPERYFQTNTNFNSSEFHILMGSVSPSYIKKGSLFLLFPPCSVAISVCEWCCVLSSGCIPCQCDCIPDNEEEARQTRPNEDHTNPCPSSL